MANYVCDFGNVHDCAKICDCQRRYKCLASEFRNALVNKYGKFVEEPFRYGTRTVMAQPLYPVSITPNMRDGILREITSDGPTTTFQILEKRNLA